MSAADCYTDRNVAIAGARADATVRGNPGDRRHPCACRSFRHLSARGARRRRHQSRRSRAAPRGRRRQRARRKMSTSFLTQASNKRSLTLDLKRESDRAILKKLVATADVFVENYRPGAFDALWLGYEALSAISSEL